MKLPALLIALVAFAGGTAFAQAPASKIPGEAPASVAAEKTAPAKVHKKKMAHKHKAAKAEKHASAKHHAAHHVASAKRHHAQHMASAKRHHAQHLASAKHHGAQHMASARHSTRAMGAGPASPATDLNASARQHRMDSAYGDWLARRR